MHTNQAWLIVVEEDLWIQINPSIKPVNEKDGAEKKQLLPISMDWMEPCLFETVREMAVVWLSVQWFMNIKAIR